ncbi:MAG: hypothetical protein IJI57_09030 [Flexilinea sp.]|nr:hypothetical protein [Flexilinea sp.]
MEKEWFEKLTDVQKTKLRELGGNAEDLIAFCKEEKLELPDELLEAASGGLCGGFVYLGCEWRDTGI